MDFSYSATPFLAWLIAGSLKLIINSIRTRCLALHLVGYGGIPSNHSAIVSSMTTLIAIKEGISSATFGISLTLTLITIIDASSLRLEVGKHASFLNKFLVKENGLQPLREQMGHSAIEIICGLMTGIFTAIIAVVIFN